MIKISPLVHRLWNDVVLVDNRSVGLFLVLTVATGEEEDMARLVFPRIQHVITANPKVHISVIRVLRRNTIRDRSELKWTWLRSDLSRYMCGVVCGRGLVGKTLSSG